MGTIFDLTYPALAMGYVDITSYQKTENWFNITTKYESMKNWK